MFKNILKTFKFLFKNYRFCQKSGNEANSKGQREEEKGVMFFVSLQRNGYENRYMIHPLPLLER